MFRPVRYRVLDLASRYRDIEASTSQRTRQAAAAPARSVGQHEPPALRGQRPLPQRSGQRDTRAVELCESTPDTMVLRTQMQLRPRPGLALLDAPLEPGCAPTQDFAWRHTLDTVEPAHAGQSPPPQALPAYDDASWKLVDAPHDMGIEGPIDYKFPADQGFRKRTAGWYRKHFQLPSEWKGSSVWVYIEGSFHVTNSYFNGRHLGEHPAGYTSFWLKLSEGAKWGEENVLALHVNATTGTGWWCEPLASLSHSFNCTACCTNLPRERAGTRAAASCGTST